MGPAVYQHRRRNNGKNKRPVSVSTKHYKPIKPKCKKCNDGALERRQWGMLSCTNRQCDHKELQ